MAALKKLYNYGIVEKDCFKNARTMNQVHSKTTQCNKRVSRAFLDIPFLKKTLVFLLFFKYHTFYIILIIPVPSHVQIQQVQT